MTALVCHTHLLLIYYCNASARLQTDCRKHLSTEQSTTFPDVTVTVQRKNYYWLYLLDYFNHSGLWESLKMPLVIFLFKKTPRYSHGKNASKALLDTYLFLNTTQAHSCMRKLRLSPSQCPYVWLTRVHIGCPENAAFDILAQDPQCFLSQLTRTWFGSAQSAEGSDLLISSSTWIKRTSFLKQLSPWHTLFTD